jgi:hypothetical protein
MKRLVLFASAALSAAPLSGCVSQKIEAREYYEPTEGTLVTREDGTKIGAVKSETVKSGSPDWSDSKSISLISVGK